MRSYPRCPPVHARGRAARRALRRDRHELPGPRARRAAPGAGAGAAGGTNSILGKIQRRAVVGTAFTAV